MTDLTTQEKIRAKAFKIRNDAVLAFNEANNRALELEKMATLYEVNKEDLKASRVTAIEAVATQIESEWLQQIIVQRQAMKDRGEDISAPKSIEELKTELQAQSKE